ncbi:hypothetical protein UFOVP207_32 [uncultured Caudovirales phage]|uniref:Uncharacterized protein n=1 Tax=uncultured Caudovirales phage TaxID=2100421 RepID=A0A6J7WJB2_9CAUD|nr:hypothetical protein UFOVP207_32 [uncultured Caudovirales phage]
MPTSTTTVDYYGIRLECEYDWDHYRAQTYWEPAEGGFECITKVMHHGEDIMELLSDIVIEGLETKIQERDE